jgi:hypothetical protein
VARLDDTLRRLWQSAGPVVVTVAVIAVAAAFFRAIAIPKWHTLWAEDGSVFAACAYGSAPLSCFVTAYQGYVHFVPRLAAAISVLFDPRLLPLAITACAACANAIAAAFAARAIAQTTGSRAMGLLGGAGLVLVYQAGREVGGELGNAHLVLFAATAIVLISTWLGRACDRLDWALIVVTGLTTAFAPALPVLALGGLVARTARARSTLILTAAGVVPQLVAELTNRRDYIGHPVTIAETITGFWQLVVREGFYGPLHPFWGEVTFVAILGVAGWLTVLAVLDLRRDGRAGVASAWPVLATAGLIGLAAAAWLVSVQLNGGLTPRYAYEPAALLVAALALGTGLAGRAGLRALGARSVPDRVRVPGGIVPLAVAVVVGVAFAATFRLQARSSYGPDAAKEIRAITTCPAGTAVVIPVSPIERPMYLSIPCDRLNP